MDAVIREAGPSDAEAVVAVLRASITELCVEDHHGDPETLSKWLANKTPESFLRWTSDSESFCVVAEVGGGIVGVALLGSTGDIRLCYVRPGFLGKAIGSSMLIRLEDEARKRGLHRLTAESTRSAQQFYRAMGFYPAGAAKPGFGLSRCHPMQKRLDQGLEE